MRLGSLNDVIMEFTEYLIESVDYKSDDMFCMMGEAAVHRTLEEHDVSYLWEFAALNEEGKMVKVTFNRKDINDGIRQSIDSYHDTNEKAAKDASSFEANKKTLSDDLDKNINFLKGPNDKNIDFSSEISRLESFKNRIQEEQFPKTWLAKKIAWFRSLYAKFMHKNTASPEPGFVGIIKRICATILRIIDTLTRKLQNAVN